MTPETTHIQSLLSPWERPCGFELSTLANFEQEALSRESVHDQEEFKWEFPLLDTITVRVK